MAFPVKVIFKHWKTGQELTEVGTLPLQLNRPSSDRYILRTENGKYVDILKNTVIAVEKVTTS